MAELTKEEYIKQHGLPFDINEGRDPFREIPPCPEIEDVSDEFKEANCYMGNHKVMRAGVQINYTDEMIDEIDKCENDILYFLINYGRIVSLDKGVIPFGLFQYQKNMIKLIEENRFTIFNFPRQMGKCVDGKTTITVRNKTTGKVEDIMIEKFFNRLKES